MNEFSKDKPEIRSDYNKSKNLKRKYERLAGISKPTENSTSLKDLLR